MVEPRNAFYVFEHLQIRIIPLAYMKHGPLVHHFVQLERMSITAVQGAPVKCQWCSPRGQALASRLNFVALAFALGPVALA